MICFFIAPVLNFRLVIRINQIKAVEVIALILFCLINIYFLIIPNILLVFGGFFTNSQFCYSKIIIFFYYFKFFNPIYLHNFKEKLNNSLIFQYSFFQSTLTIYHKYYDPLILIIFMTLINFDIKKHFFDKEYRFLQLYLLSICYLAIGIFKNQIY